MLDFDNSFALFRAGQFQDFSRLFSCGIYCQLQNPQGQF